MEPKGSLPHSQVPTPVPILSHINPNYALHPISWRSVFLLFSHLHLGLPSGFFPSGFPTQTLYALLLSPYMLYAPLISFLHDHPS